jgi:hypothetical protein
LRCRCACSRVVQSCLLLWWGRLWRRRSCWRWWRGSWLWRGRRLLHSGGSRPAWCGDGAGRGKRCRGLPRRQTGPHTPPRAPRCFHCGSRCSSWRLLALRTRGGAPMQTTARSFCPRLLCRLPSRSWAVSRSGAAGGPALCVPSAATIAEPRSRAPRQSRDAPPPASSSHSRCRACSACSAHNGNATRCARTASVGRGPSLLPVRLARALRLWRWRRAPLHMPTTPRALPCRWRPARRPRRRQLRVRGPHAHQPVLSA